VTVTVVTDGGAALPAEVAGAYGVEVVPLGLALGGDPLDGDGDGLARVVASPAGAAHTSSPPPGRFLAVLRRHGDGGVLICTVAAALSSTYQSALLAARQAGGPVRVLDSGSAAGGQALVVLAAARAARAGGTLDQVAAAAERAAAEVRLAAAVDSLERLVAGGRVPEVLGWAGRRLGLLPLFELRAGRVRPLAPAFSRAAAERRMLARWRAGRTPGAAAHVVALHALAPQRAERLLAAVRAEVDPATAFVCEFDAAMVAHTGPGVVGLAWRWELTS
jgi:DegV family protein with EDD domain